MISTGQRCVAVATPQVIKPPAQGEPVLVAFALACPVAPSAVAAVAAVAAEEAAGDAEEPAEDEDVAPLDEEGSADDVLPELDDAEEPAEAEDPSLA